MICACLLAGAAASASSGAARERPVLTVKLTQVKADSLLERRTLPLRVTSRRKGKVSVSVALIPDRTRKAIAIGRTLTLGFWRAGKRSARLKLSARARKIIARCEPMDLRATVRLRGGRQRSSTRKALALPASCGQAPPGSPPPGAPAPGNETVPNPGLGQAFPNPPYAAGDSAGNVALDTAQKAVMTRWVARHTGTLKTLYLKIRVAGSAGCRYDNRPGYANGTSGRLLATTHPVLADGRPDIGVELSRDEFSPCGRERGESVDLPMNLAVQRGQEYATVVRNTDPLPTVNYFSINFLRSASGLWGANGRNERTAGAGDLFYGLDPREIVGYTYDDGARWKLPGPGPHVPTYIQEYTDGFRDGQFYFYTQAMSGPVTMVFPKVAADWTISHLGAYTAGPGSARVTLTVDGAERASVTLAGTGMLRGAIAPVQVRRGQTVKVSTTAGDGGLAVRRLVSDWAWADILGLGPGYSFYLEGDAKRAATIYPLPGPLRDGTSQPGGDPPPGGNPLPPLP
jgi:hypothetical protein